ncbi:MAG: patatin-like phospholipase family protein [Alphaproteobacteria bacterium]|jgi:patatin-like phospholipase/acyl hydrolase|nr:patatin-like phospholipase family protein [Candidatus Jidaibacter sp.]
MSYACRVLSVDGGGIRGIIPARILKELELRADKPLTKLFDLGVGTSTGGIIVIAASLVDDYGSPLFPADAMIDLYLNKGSEIFEISTARKLFSGDGLFKAKIDRTNIDKLLEEYFTDHKLSDAFFPIAVTSYDLDTCKPHIWSTLDSWKNPKIDAYMKDVAGATSAAPTYFSPKPITMKDGSTHYFIDGGMFQNNPQIVPLLEVIKLDANIDRSDMLMVSIGTGTAELALKGKDLVDAGIIGWMQGARLIDVMMDGASDFSDLEGNIIYPNRYRIQVDISSELSEMDKPENGPLLLAAAENWIAQNSSMLDKIVDDLLLQEKELANEIKAHELLVSDDMHNLQMAA